MTDRLTEVDIRVIWDQCASVNPPNHINFLNPPAMRLLAQRCDLAPLEVFTPGELDIDIFRNNAGMISDRVWSLVVGSDDDSRARWQTLIAETGGSSHMWAVLSKSADDQ